MDALSSKTFQPIQPDGYVLSSLGKEAPKIEITETDSLCQDPLSAAGCDVPLCEWDDLHHHGDNGVPGDSSDHRRGSLSRRGEGGPGKCPSPSRNSPRRHSPVPYSPKRQNRTRSSASSAASEEFPDITLSPRRHSPVPGSPQTERPSSLSLASGPTEEFICVSYTDPFSSPTITHTSEAILAISINCSHDGSSDQDVDMVPQDSTSDHSGSGVDGADVSSASPSNSSVTRTSVSDSLLQQEGFRGSSRGKNGFESQAENGHDVTDMSVECGVKNPSPMESAKSGGGDYQVAVASGSGVLACDSGREVAESDPSSGIRESGDCVRAVEFMEGEDDFLVDEVTDSDSSSDDEMIDFVSPPHETCVNYSPCRHVSDFRNNNPGTQCSSFTKCSQHQTYESPHGLCESESYTQTNASNASTSLDSSKTENMQTAVADSDRNQSSADHSAARSLPKELSQPPCTVPGSWAARRASFPDHHLTSCSSKEVSPRRSLSHHVSMTPVDFALCCVVGSPPLTFPHCQHAVLVHCSLPSPYDPDLPTPPIVLTPHTSYEDLNLDPVKPDTQLAQEAKPGVRVIHKGSVGKPNDGSFQSPSISRSRSFPKLNQTEGQFQEPDQAWPVLGADGGQCGDSDDMSDSEEHPRTKRQCDNRRSSDGDCVSGEVSDMGELCGGGATTTTSVSLPGSPSNSRQAVIGRLRRVVERRLSGTSDTMEEALHGGGSQ
ncbi:hypothetical protein ACOMHN_017653 [Nucella lapillus]